MRKIVVPVAFLDRRPKWLDYAVDMARKFDAELILLHVVDYAPTMLPVDLPSTSPMPQLETVKQAAGEKLAQIAAEIEGVKVTPRVTVGAAAREVVECADREGADHIIIASQTRGALARIVLGSVAERVARTAHCPVTLVPMPKQSKGSE